MYAPVEDKPIPPFFFFLFTDCFSMSVLQSLHAQALSKLDELAGFNPEQIAVLTSRLREERDESRRAIEFVQVERQALENTSHALISKLQRDHEHVLNETTAERNALVLAISTLQQTLRSWVQSHSLSQNAETNDVKGSPTAGKAAMEDNNMSYNISIASHLRGDLGMSYDDGLGTPRFVRPEGSYRQSLSGPQDHPNVIESRPYDTALEQITTLTKQVDDLKEQLLQTYVVHQEQEKLALHDVEQLRSELLSTREQHSQAQEQQARTISSLELQFSGIQHQFHSLEICYNALRKENDALKHEMVEESERSVQLKADRESMQATTDSLRIQIESMNEEIQRYKQHISDLQNQHSLANQSSAATSEEQTSQLMTQIGQLTHDLKEQKILTDSLEEQLNAAVLIQREHLSTVKRLEETLEGQTLETQATLDSKKEELLVQKGDFERQLSELSESLEEKSALNIQLQESVTALTARIQEENDSHRQIQTESERKLSETTELRAVVDEKHKLLEDQVEELLEKTKALEDENKSLSDKLGVATEEQEALKDKMATELSSTKEELAMVIISRDSMGLQLDQVNQEIRLLTEELEHVKSGQNFNAQSTEKYDNLLSEFKALEERLPALT
jgi:chromosome segregation ATPase